MIRDFLSNKIRLKTIFLISFLLFFVPEYSLAAEGDIIWEQLNNYSTINDDAYGVAVDSTGVYVVGTDEVPGEQRFRIEKRSLGDGSLLWSQVRNYSAATDEAREVAVDSTGVYIVGSENVRWRMEKRSLGDGSLLWSRFSNPTAFSFAYGVAVDSTGVYIVGTESDILGDVRWRIEKRRLGNGSLLWSQVSNPTAGDDGASGVAVDSTGVYIVGVEDTPSDDRWRIEKRRLGDGSLLWSQVSNFTAGTTEAASGVAVDSTGVYIVGLENLQWRMEKRSPGDGSLLWSQVSNPTPTLDIAFGVAVDSTGVYIVGAESMTGGNHKWRIEKRSLGDGSLLWSQVSNPTATFNEAKGVAVDSTGVYIVGRDVLIALDSQWRIEKREIASYIDCGLRIRDNTGTVTIACEPLGTLTSPLRINKNGNTYGVALVDLSDPNATKIRINTTSGIKALRRF